MNLVYNEMCDVEADRNSDRLPAFAFSGEFVPSGKQKSIVAKLMQMLTLFYSNMCNQQCQCSLCLS